MKDIDIRILSAAEVAASTGELGAILADCVEGGASVNFMLPYTADEGRRFFEKTVGQIAAGEIILLAAYIDGVLEGTVQLGIGQPPNQQHRADVKKLLVHRRARGKGLGEALMNAVEALAREKGRMLLCLDTAQGSGGDRLYQRLGWTLFGIVPRFAHNVHGTLEDCCFYFRELTP